MTERWPKITIQFPPSFTLSDFEDALKLPPEAVVEVEINGMGAATLGELSKRIPGSWISATKRGGDARLGEDHSAALWRMRGRTDESTMARVDARARIIKQCVVQGLDLDHTVAFLDLLERGANP